MCGIAAMIDLHGRARAAPWALRALRHRGPDGEGTFTAPDGNVALEHTRLAIIDPDNPAANQPFTDRSGRWTMVYNGELFNFRELRTELERKGVVFVTQSDTEVLLEAFAREGIRILPRLRGMFAFVVYDRTTGEVFAARDQIGVKPFYYGRYNGLFIGCSELRPLLVSPGHQPSFDPAGVVEFLAFGDNPGERTLVDGVRKLLPGQFLRIRNGELRVHEYWDVIPPPPSGHHAEDAAGELLTKLDGAIAASLVSDVPLGLMLSGGIDSSAIAALAVRHVSARELTAYSVAFGRSDDEAEAAARFAHELGITHRVLHVTEDRIRAELESWLTDLDYPTGNPTWIACSFIAGAAAADGIKVLLSGDGGDELFGGYTRWMKYLRFHDTVWARLPSFGRRIAGTAVRPLLGGLAGDIARRASTGAGLFVPSRPFHDDLLHRCLGPAGHRAARSYPPEKIVDDLRRVFDERMPDGDYLAWMSYIALKTKLVEDFLQRLDKMGMRHSVEGRVPLLDPDVATWALSLPQAMKVPGFREKDLLRRAVAPVLPAYVLNRRKQGFCPPVASWCEQLLANRSARTTGPLFESGLLSPDCSFFLEQQRRRNPFALWTLRLLIEWSEKNLPFANIADADAVAA